MSKASDLARLLTSGSTSLHGEAGVTASGSTGLTTNLQQGLCKHWITLDGSGTVTVLDSFISNSLSSVHLIAQTVCPCPTVSVPIPGAWKYRELVLTDLKLLGIFLPFTVAQQAVSTCLEPIESSQQ